MMESWNPPRPNNRSLESTGRNTESTSGNQKWESGIQCSFKLDSSLICFFAS